MNNQNSHNLRRSNIPSKDADGRVRYFNSFNELHSEYGPAVEYDNGDKYWYINGKLHRENGPAVELADGYKEYYINGKYYKSLEEGLMDQALG